MKEYKVIAKFDLEIDGDLHRWTRGEKYRVIQTDSHIKLQSNQGEVNFEDDVKNEVLKYFVIKGE